MNNRTEWSVDPPPGWDREGPPSDQAWAGEGNEADLNITDYLRLVWARRWIVLAVTAAVVLVSVMWSMTRQEVYRAKTTISIDARTPQITKSQFLFGPAMWEQERYLKEQERVLQSYDLARQVVSRIGLVGVAGAGGTPAPESLIARIKIDTEPEAGILNLTMTGSDPEQIAEWLNIFVDEFIRFNIEDGLRRTQQVYEVIQSRLDPLRDQLKDSEVRLTSFKERQDSLLAGDQDKNVISEQVNTLTTEFATAKAERIRLETRIRALEQLRDDGIAASTSTELLNDPTVEGLRQQVTSAEVQLQEALKTYREGHPVIKDLRSRLEATRSQIQEQVATVLGSLLADFDAISRRETMLFENLQLLRDETIELSRQTMEYETLRRDYEQNKSFYEEMLARSKEAEITGTVSFNRVRIIDRARVPTSPIFPNVPRAGMTSLAVGLFLSVGLILFVDFLDRSIRTPDEVERHLGLEVFAVVPVSQNVKQRALLEVYQGLRTALMFAARDDSCQLVMVSSAGPGEGKTTTTMNLGKVLSAGGSKVLIIEGDLRKPAIRRMLDNQGHRGLTTVILGHSSLSESITTLDGYPDLDILTSGPPPPNPPELFGKASFKQLLDEVRGRYEWVLIDSPPVVSVTDAVICSNWVDMVLFVIEYGRLDRKVLQGAKRQLTRAGARVIGAVLNRVDLQRSHYYYDAHYYSYYYGFEDDKAKAANDEPEAQ